MNKFLRMASCAAVFVAFAGAAQATPFDLEGIAAGYFNSPIIVNDGAVTLTISADGGGTFLNVQNSGVPLVGQGVVASFTNPLQVDQFSPLRFSFNQLISNITFNFGDAGGDNDSPVAISAFNGSNVLLGAVTGSYPAGANSGGSLSLNFAGARYFVATSGTPGPGNNANSLLWDIAGYQTGGGGVPEPATWAMMIIGFGAAGSMIRRRKAVVA